MNQFVTVHDVDRKLCKFLHTRFTQFPRIYSTVPVYCKLWFVNWTWKTGQRLEAYFRSLHRNKIHNIIDFTVNFTCSILVGVIWENSGPLVLNLSKLICSTLYMYIFEKVEINLSWVKSLAQICVLCYQLWL
jgi:hypothetical protein